MHTPRNEIVTRRDFLASASTLGALALLGIPRNEIADLPPEVNKIRLVKMPAICLAPQYLAQELLRLEGISEIEYVPARDDDSDPYVVVADGRADMTMDGATALVPAFDVGRPIVALAGVHGGCYELLGNERVRAIRDLKDKSIAIAVAGAADHVYLSSMLAYVGINPQKEVRWIETGTFDGPMEFFLDRKVDAFLGFPPQPQLVRARKVGHVVVNTAEDRPWSGHFCCMIAANREFVRAHPVTTKRVIRAMLKAADVCAREPEHAASYLVKNGYEGNYRIALEVVKEVSYNAWRNFDPEDTLRFHALRLHEVGMIKTEPNKLIAHGTNWRFINELRKELKA
jgi:NitT/TauT family transport system substrate-binding protein